MGEIEKNWKINTLKKHVIITKIMKDQLEVLIRKFFPLFFCVKSKEVVAE
jgi:hypothetical protein